MALSCPHKVLEEAGGGKYTPELHENICKLIRAGNYRETACAAVGIHSGTLRKWLRAAAAGDSRYIKLAEDMAEAEAVAESRFNTVITASAGTAQKPGDWKAAAWWLERRFPHRYGPQIKVAVANELEKFFKILEEVLDRDSLQRVYTALAATGSGQEAADFIDLDVEVVEEHVAGGRET